MTSHVRASPAILGALLTRLATTTSCCRAVEGLAPPPATAAASDSSLPAACDKCAGELMEGSLINTGVVDHDAPF